MNTKKIAIIGGGNLGRAIAEGLISDSFYAPEHITVTRRQIEKLEDLEQQGIRVLPDNKLATMEAEVIVLAIKPHQIIDVLREISPVLKQGHHCLISVVTGVSLSEMAMVTG